jgi:hypothetical protein
MSAMQRPVDQTSSRAFHGAFHEYVRAVFADSSGRARRVRASRARWLRGLGRAPASAAETSWEGEGGSTL